MSSPSPPLPGSPCGYHAVADMQPSSLYQHLQRLHLQQSQYGGATGVTPPSSSFPCRAAAASPLLPHSKTDVTAASPTHHRNSPPPNNLHIIKEDSFDACDASSRVGDLCDCRAKQLQKPHISVTDTHGHVTSMLTSHDDVLSLVKLSVSGGATETPSAPINVPAGGSKYTLPSCLAWNDYSGIAPQYAAVDLANIPSESAMDVDARPPSSFDLFTSQLAAMQKGRQTFTTFNLDTYCCPWETCSNFARSISTGSGQPSKQISDDITRATSFTKLFENA